MDEFRQYPDGETQNKYSRGLTLQEYKGAFYLVSSRRTEKGDIAFEWCYPQRDRAPMEKAIPWKIKLGDSRKEAFEMLANFGRILK